MTHSAQSARRPWRRTILATLAVGWLLAACAPSPSLNGTTGPSPAPPVATVDASGEAAAEATGGTPPADGDLGQLITELESRVDANPQDAVALTELGHAYLQRARETSDPTQYGLAQRALDAAVGLEPENANALIGAGILALARHEFSEALELGERASELDRTSPAALGVIADAQTELGRYDEAIATVQQMLDLRPNLSSYARVSYQRELHGQLDGAIDAMESSFAAGVAGSENAEYVRVLLGNLHFSRGELDVAEQIYTESLEARADFVYAMAGLARVRAAQGATDEAVDLFEAAIARNPLPEFVIGLGETLEGAGRMDAARQQYELVGAIQQLFAANGVDVDLDLALFEANHGDDPQRAVDLARSAYERTPNVRAADALAWALHRAGEIDEATDYAAEALRLGTQDGLFYYHAGAIAAAAGDVERARGFLEDALALNPHFSPLYATAAAQLLEELEREGGMGAPWSFA